MIGLYTIPAFEKKRGESKHLKLPLPLLLSVSTKNLIFNISLFLNLEFT